MKFKLYQQQNFTFESLYKARWANPDGIPYTFDNGSYSDVAWTPPAGTTFGQLTDMHAVFNYTQGQTGGGSIRWSIGVEHNGVQETVFVYYGPGGVNTVSPFVGLTSDNGTNMVGGPGNVELFNVSAGSYGSYQLALDRYANDKVDYVALVLDTGWEGDQVVNLTSATVNGDTFTWPAATQGVQTNEPTAYLSIRPLTGGVTYPIDESLLTSAQGDSGGVFRQVDGMYIYNLDLKTLGLGQGKYEVGIKFDPSTGIKPLPNPGQFGLK